MTIKMKKRLDIYWEFDDGTTVYCSEVQERMLKYMDTTNNWSRQIEAIDAMLFKGAAFHESINLVELEEYLEEFADNCAHEIADEKKK